MSEKYAFWVTLRPKSDPYHRGEAKVRILNFKTTWSEFQRASQTATEPESVTSSCVLKHTKDVPAQWVLPSSQIIASSRKWANNNSLNF